MKTAKITAQLALAGKIAVQLDIDITDHQARELLDAIATTLNNDKWSDGNVTRVEKDKLSLTRKSKDDLDQQTIDFPAEERPVVLQGEFQVIEMEKQKMLEHYSGDLTSDDGVPDAERPDYDGTEEGEEEGAE